VSVRRPFAVGGVDRLESRHGTKHCEQVEHVHATIAIEIGIQDATVLPVIQEQLDIHEIDAAIARDIGIGPIDWNEKSMRPIESRIAVDFGNDLPGRQHSLR